MLFCGLDSELRPPVRYIAGTPRHKNGFKFLMNHFHGLNEKQKLDALQKPFSKTGHVNMRDGSENQFEMIARLFCWTSWRPTTVYMSTQVEKTLKTLITH